MASVHQFLEEISWLDPPVASAQIQNLDAAIKVPGVDRAEVVRHERLLAKATLLLPVLSEELLHSRVSA